LSFFGQGRKTPLRAAEQFHLSEQLFDPGPHLFALAPQIIQFLTD
jgi:hypothetical protein